ncbi:nuclear transport factor 2 family protein [Microbacterium sp. A588]
MIEDKTERTLEQRVQELEDVREINELFRRWHNECTGGFDGLQPGRHAALEVLTDDATIEIAELHKPGEGPTGREQYTEYWNYYFGDNGPLPRVFQTGVDQSVTITGDTAIQETNQIGLFQTRGDKPRFSLSKRKNYLVRTQDGWKIQKTTGSGSFLFEVNPLYGQLNPTVDEEKRTPWVYPGD